MKLGKKKKNVSDAAENKDDFLEQEAKEMEEQAPEYTLDIPEDEIWTYQIEGLQAPKINHSYDNAKKSKIAVVVILLVAISISIFLSVRALENDEYKFTELDDGTYQLVTYTNPDGTVREVTVDYYIDKDGNRDKTKPITSLHEYAFNCDSSIERINIGKDVKEIDGKSIYSCWNLQYIDVDDENPYFCDVDGVLYTKDMTKLILYPIDYDRTLRIKNEYAYLVYECEICKTQLKKSKELVNPNSMPKGITESYTCKNKECTAYGNQYYWACHSNLFEDKNKETDKDVEMWELWGVTKRYDKDFFEEYNLKTRTYVVPSTVTEIGQLALAYSNIVDLYLPEGLEKIGDQGIFKDEELKHIYTYTSDAPITGTFYDSIPEMKNVYHSLPETLKSVGSDAFYHLRGLDYIFIPSSVEHIGHHCMWEAVYDEDGLKGLYEVNVAKSEDKLEAECELGETWIPEYNNGLFNKKVPVNYSQKRKTVLLSTYYGEVGELTANWVSSNKYDGYELEYAFNASFDDNNKTQDVKDSASTGVTVKKLEKDKTYYLRVRGYTVNNGKKTYSDWSPAHSVYVAKE